MGGNVYASDECVGIGEIDRWHDNGDGTKHMELIAVLGSRLPFNNWKLIATRDEHNNPGLCVEFPDEGKRLVVQCIEEKI